MTPNLVQRVLVLFSHIDQQDQVRRGIDNWLRFLAADPRLAGFAMEVSYADSDITYNTLRGQNPDGSMIVYADPDQIIAEAKQQELAMQQDYDIVCLVYNDKFVNGPLPNHPIDNQVYAQGFNTCSIPLSWISSLNDSSVPFSINVFAVTLFFSHELSHANYFIANMKAAAGLRDKTHDVQALSSARPDQTYGFRDYLAELKPYWPYLIATKR